MFLFFQIVIHHDNLRRVESQQKLCYNRLRVLVTLLCSGLCGRAEGEINMVPPSILLSDDLRQLGSKVSTLLQVADKRVERGQGSWWSWKCSELALCR